MHRPGVDPDSMQMTDILCDFCHSAWTEDRPFVEGHRGSCICGPCLSIAYTELIHLRLGDAPTGGDGEPEACVLCLEAGREERHWRSPATGALVCKRCAKQAAGALHKDRDIAWAKPKDPSGEPAAGA